MEKQRTGRTLRTTPGTVRVLAEVNNTPTADAIYAAVPLWASVIRWEEETYFEIPARAVNVFGRITGDRTIIKAVKSRTRIVIEKVEP